jgi:flagellar hook-associated protein 3 FlgL
MALRVTPRTAQRIALDGLGANLSRMTKLQEKMASGKQINRPSDSPIATVSAMQYRSDIRRNEQFSRNANDGLNWLGIADETLTGLMTTVGRVRELVIRGKNASMGQSERGNIAAEIATLKDTLIGLANVKYLDRPIFAGNADVPNAYDATGSFQGQANDFVERRIGPNMKVRVNTTGPEVFGVENGVDGSLFEVVQKIVTDLTSDPTALDADLDLIDQRVVDLQNELGGIGARYHQVEGMRDRADDTNITLTNGLSEIENIDLPRTIVDLQLQEVAYQSALAATARVIQPSLVDFLR